MCGFSQTVCRILDGHSVSRSRNRFSWSDISRRHPLCEPKRAGGRAASRRHQVIHQLAYHSAGIHWRRVCGVSQIDPSRCLLCPLRAWVSRYAHASLIVAHPAGRMRYRDGHGEKRRAWQSSTESGSGLKGAATGNHPCVCTDVETPSSRNHKVVGESAIFRSTYDSASASSNKRARKAAAAPSPRP
jgi:hypothetical protein